MRGENGYRLLPKAKRLPHRLRYKLRHTLYKNIASFRKKCIFANINTSLDLFYIKLSTIFLLKETAIIKM